MAIANKKQASINKEEKKAMLVVSFGTSYPDAIKRDIAAVEKKLAAAYPEYTQRRAFTSNMIIKKLKARDKVAIDTPDAALTKLADAGYADVVIIPLHILHGFEYDDLKAVAYQHLQNFTAIRMGIPILSCDEDYDMAVAALKQQIPELSGNKAVIVMGHGTGHYADASYSKLQLKLEDAGLPVYVATVEGYPTIYQAEKRMAQAGKTDVMLMPFMLVAGDHATNDMAGDTPDSYKNILKSKGYAVEIYLHGLGENPGFQDMWIKHAQDAIASAPLINHRETTSAAAEKPSDIKMRGKLYGIGVGPGAPDLLTLRAVRALGEADTLVCPASRTENGSRAYDIVSAYLQDGVEILTQEFPMTSDIDEKNRKWKQNADEIRQCMDAGKTIAFITLGDAMLYSTYMYILPYMVDMTDAIETIPGVTSYSAVAAAAEVPLAAGEETLAIIPLTYEPDNLDAVFNMFDNVIVMKASHNPVELAAALERHGLQKKFVLVSACGTEDETMIKDINELKSGKIHYLSTMIIKKN